MCKKFKLKAFTLSEVLIALVIIGVITAITVPAIIQTTDRRETITGLKKAYSTLTNWERMPQVDYGHSSTWENAKDIGIDSYYTTYIKPYFNIMKYCSTGTECGYKSDAPFTQLDGTAGVFVAASNRVAFVTIDGMSYSFVVFSNITGEYYPVIKVDINGARKPNKYGRDVFIFYRTDDIGIKAYGYNKSQDAVKKDCSKSGAGNYCAARIMKNSWDFDDGYPW